MQPIPAKTRHAQGILQLMTSFSDEEILLPRSLNEIFSQIPQFFVIEHDSQVIGCASIEIFSQELGEVRSLAVDPKYQGNDLGKKLLDAIETYGRELGLSKMMALTYVEQFFHRYGYKTVEMSTLPEKVWRVCVKCPNFHNCDEIPVLKQL